MAWALLSTVFLACFPALMDVASGYEPAEERFLALPDSQANIKVADERDLPRLDGTMYTRTKTNLTLGGAAMHAVRNYTWADPAPQESWNSVYSESFFVPFAERSCDDLLIVSPRETPRFFLADPHRPKYQCMIEEGHFVWDLLHNRPIGSRWRLD